MITSNINDGSNGASENCFDSCNNTNANNNLEAGWSDKTGLKSKIFSQIELEAFRKPLKLGWKREIVLRSTHTNSGKKIVDIYYFSPERNVKLRSYVEIGYYLNRHPESDLEPENFTFARQPIFNAPYEIIRQANPRARNENSEIPSPNYQRSRSRSERSDKSEKIEKSEKMEKITDRIGKEPDVINEIIVDSFDESVPDEPFNNGIPMVIPSMEGEDHLLGNVSHEEVITNETNEIPRKKLKITATSSSKRSDQTNNVGFTNHQESLLATTKAGLNGDITNHSVNHSTIADVVGANEAPTQPKRKTKSKFDKSLKQPPSSASSVAKSVKLKVPDHPEKVKLVNGVVPLDGNNHVNNLESYRLCESEPKSTQSKKKSKSKSSSSAAKLEKSIIRPENGSNKRIVLTKSLPKKSDSEKEIRKEIENNENYADDFLHCSLSVTPLASPDSKRPVPSSKSTIVHRYDQPAGVEFRNHHLHVLAACKMKSKFSCNYKLDKKNGKKEKKDIVDAIIDSIPEEILNNLPPMLHPPPCSLLCFGRRGLIPTLLCDRCLCLYHPECVPAGLFLNNSHSFICPNCTQSSDIGECVAFLNARLVAEPETLSIGMNFRSKKGNNLVIPPMLIQGLKSRNHKYSPSEPPNSILGPSHQQHHHSNHHQYHPPPDHSSYSKNSKKSSLRSDQPVLTNMSSNIESASSILSPDPIELAGYHETVALFNRRRKTSTESRLPTIPIAPIAPIKYTASGIAEILNTEINKSRKTLSRIKPELNVLSSGYECLNQIFQYLGTRDLIKIKSTSRTFNRLASQPLLWQEVLLKDLIIKDWQYFGRNIIEPMGTQSINFAGIKSSPGSDLSETWSNFSTITDYLKSVKHMQFGAVPTSVIEEIINAAVTENCYNSFSNLETLSIRHLFEDESAFSSCNLSILENIAYLSSLQHLRVDCKYGLIVHPEDSDLLDRIFAPMTNLKSLSMTTLKGFTIDQFSFLSHLKNLISLEIGSCLSWANNHDIISSTSSSLSSTSPLSSPSQQSPSSPLSSQPNFDHQYQPLGPGEEEMEEQLIEEDGTIVPDGIEDCLLPEVQQGVQIYGEIEVEGEVECVTENGLDPETEPENLMLKEDLPSTTMPTFTAPSTKSKLKGVFKHLSKLTLLKHLKLVDLTLDEFGDSFSRSLGGIVNLTSLQLVNLKIVPDTSHSITLLAADHLKNLKDLLISTADPHTNYCVLRSLPNLGNLEHLTWKIQVSVEDDGHCWIPILNSKRRTGSETEEEANNLDLFGAHEDGIEIMDLDQLIQIIETSHPNTKINIVPQ